MLSNAAACLAILALLAVRTYFVGLTNAFAEMIGIASLGAFTEWRDAYRPRHPSLFGELQDTWLDQRLVAALQNKSHHHEALRSLVQPAGDGLSGVFILRLLDERFCEMLTEEVRLS